LFSIEILSVIPKSNIPAMYLFTILCRRDVSLTVSTGLLFAHEVPICCNHISGKIVLLCIFQNIGVFCSSVLRKSNKTLLVCITGTPLIVSMLLFVDEEPSITGQRDNGRPEEIDEGMENSKTQN
jgi:hypothetical protein